MRTTASARRVASEQDARTVIMHKPEGISAGPLHRRAGEPVVESDTPARVVVDERTGTIVIGQDVRISQVAISHGTLTVRITEMPKVVQPEPFSEGETAVEPYTDDRGRPARRARRRARRARPRNAGLRPQPPRRQAGRHHRHPAGHQVRRRPAGRTGPAMRLEMAIRPTAARRSRSLPRRCVALSRSAAAWSWRVEPGAGPRSGDERDRRRPGRPQVGGTEVERFCSNIADAARDRRYASGQGTARR